MAIFKCFSFYRPKLKTLALTSSQKTAERIAREHVTTTGYPVVICPSGGGFSVREVRHHG